MTDRIRAEFEAWCSKRWRGERGAFVRKHDDSGYIMERLDFALDAFAAGRQSALEEAAKACEAVSATCFFESNSADRCVEAIRSLASTEQAERNEGEKR